MRQIGTCAFFCGLLAAAALIGRPALVGGQVAASVSGSVRAADGQF
ncbi:MAG: hypothetical protein NT169_20055 [Chloroflexi bacterium]|nr:hypothetical protein [Chloroflexota bacterium]